MRRTIDCLERLLELNNSYEEICEWLLLNKFTDDVSVKEYTRRRERAEFIYSILARKEKSEDIMLLYFEWSILPKETIKITCVTATEEKLFTYGI